MSPRLPSYYFERDLMRQGFDYIAGVDEAGCGCWAGPVYAAAVIFPLNARLGLVRDSKTLSEMQRLRLSDQIRSKATAWAVGTATVEEIDQYNIRQAAALAMKRAVEALSPAPQALLIDAFRIPGIQLPQKNIIRGDGLVKSIAAASILAKVARDLHLNTLDEQFPGYGFRHHKGYGTKEHQRALNELGICPAHRLSYAPIKRVLKKRNNRKQSPEDRLERRF